MGASEAIGRVIASTFAEEGARTAICSRPRPEEPTIVAQLCERGLDAMWAPGDMTDPASMTRAVATVVERYGGLDILVVSGSPDAGESDLFEAMDPSLYQLKINAQFLSRLNCLHAALPPMIGQHYGKVIFVTTDAGRTPTPGLSVSGAAAAALMYFTRSGGKELARRGIRVNCLPITVTADTPQYDSIVLSDANNPVAKAYKKVESKTPFRLTVPIDIAKTAVFLASPDSDQISGAVISINGGLAFP